MRETETKIERGKETGEDRKKKRMSQIVRVSLSQKERERDKKA